MIDPLPTSALRRVTCSRLHLILFLVAKSQCYPTAVTWIWILKMLSPERTFPNERECSKNPSTISYADGEENTLQHYTKTSGFPGVISIRFKSATSSWYTMKVHGHDGNWQWSRRSSKATTDENEPQTFGLTG
ncbi:hypothetical protein DPMN_036246 [Dreissena polymorpha]|uniref:Uncharacterized protein n=1 Tax=Dreissena polymorpha TaxID=45954 RepID=A0A9D4MB68_DREPO|nr:hypothetical protein DPMN_036246 [Dreissena polymorpha]